MARIWGGEGCRPRGKRAGSAGSLAAAPAVMPGESGDRQGTRGPLWHSPPAQLASGHRNSCFPGLPTQP